MDKKTETVVAVAEEAVKKNLLTPKRLLIVAGVVVVGVGATLFLKSRKNTEVGDEVVEAVKAPEPKHVQHNGNKK